MHLKSLTNANYQVNETKPKIWPCKKNKVCNFAKQEHHWCYLLPRGWKKNKQNKTENSYKQTLHHYWMLVKKGRYLNLGSDPEKGGKKTEKKFLNKLHKSGLQLKVFMSISWFPDRKNFFLIGKIQRVERL